MQKRATRERCRGLAQAEDYRRRPVATRAFTIRARSFSPDITLPANPARRA